MFNRLLISHRISGPFIKIMTVGLVSAFACAWIFTSCDQRTTPTVKAPDTKRVSQEQPQQTNQSAQLSIDLATAVEQVADVAIPAVVHIDVKEHQELANPFLRYKDNPFFRRFFGLPKNMPKKLERELIGIGTGVIIDPEGLLPETNESDNTAESYYVMQKGACP